MNNSTAFVCRRQSQPPQISIGICGGDYSVKFPFDRAFLDRFKAAIPATQRGWNSDLKAWIVAPSAIEKTKALLEENWQTTVEIPVIEAQPAQIIEKTFTLEYLGACRDRGGYSSAYGCVNGQWVTEFSETVLREFFDDQGEIQTSPNSSQTLYRVLLIEESATDHEIRSAYRRLARQWHPDVCKEDNAAEMFRKIKDAYETLMDPAQRKRYNAGLYFERQAAERDHTAKIHSRLRYATGYRSPLRCGDVTAQGSVKLGRFVVSKILRWQDTVNDQNQVMVSTWPAGADKFTVIWV